MTTPQTGAVAIREAIFARMSTLPGYTTYRRVLMPQLEVDQLPTLSIGIVSEALTPDGDDNVGEPHFHEAVTIGIGIARGFSDPVALDGQIDVDAWDILQKLLCDPTFVRRAPDALFEAVTGITRRRVYPSDGETYFLELRTEITFRTYADFPPLVTTPFTGMNVTTNMPGSSGSPNPIQSDVVVTP